MAGKKESGELSEIASLAAQLQEAAEDTERQQGILGAILEQIGKLDPESAKALFRNEAVQALLERASDEHAASADDPPGTVYAGTIGGVAIKGFVKKEWTEADLRADYERAVAAGVPPGERGAGEPVSFMPFTTKPIFWNGLRRQFVAMKQMRVEQCFIDVYMQSLGAEQLAAQHAAWLFRAGPPPDDRSMITPEGATARATGSEGHYLPGGGNIALDDRGAEEAAGA